MTKNSERISLYRKNENVANTPLDTLGFEIRGKKGVPIAAVSLIEKDRIVFNTTYKKLRFFAANV